VCSRCYRCYCYCCRYPLQGLSYTEFDVKWSTPPPLTTTVTSTGDSATTYKVKKRHFGAMFT
jgi:hypothetical protein